MRSSNSNNSHINSTRRINRKRADQSMRLCVAIFIIEAALRMGIIIIGTSLAIWELGTPSPPESASSFQLISQIQYIIVLRRSWPARSPVK